MCYDKLTPPPRINLRIGESSGMLQPDRVSLIRRKLKMLGLEIRDIRRINGMAADITEWIVEVCRFDEGEFKRGGGSSGGGLGIGV